MLSFKVSNQTLARTDNFKPAGEAVKYLTASFDFLTDEWEADGISLNAIFRAVIDGEEETAYTIALDENGACLVPWEALDHTGVFYLSVSVFGIVGDVVITTNIASVLVDRTGYTEGETPAEPSPTVYAQIVADMEEIGGLIDQTEQLLADAQHLKGDCEDYAEAASQSANDASGYATTASNKANEASGYATTASNKAGEASGYATTASNKADAAANSALEAKDYRDAAKGYKDDAADLVTTAQATLNDLTARVSDLEHKALAAYVELSESGDIVAFDNGADNIPVVELVASITATQESGTPTPSTPKAISGWTGCNLRKGGKNLLDLSILRQGNFNFGNTSENNVAFDEYLPIKGGATYAWSTPLTSIAGRYCRFYDVDKQQIGVVDLYGEGTKTFTTPTNAVYYRAMWYHNNGITPSDITADQIELGSTATTYEAYNGEIKSISWQDEAGTVYGGTLNITTGVLTVDRAIVDMGDISWGMSTSTTSSVGGSVFYCDLSRIGMAERERYTENTMLSDIFATGDSSLWFISNMADCEMFSNTTRIYISYAAASSASEFISMVTGHILCYKPATPTTYQLTPTEVKTLLANNTIFANCGAVSVKYRADATTLYNSLLNA